MELLSVEWGEELVRRAASIDVPLQDAVVELQLTGAPRGRGRVTLVIEAGRPTALRPERAQDPDVRCKLAFDDLVAIVRGELDPNVAFMTGELKSEGSTGPLLALLAAHRLPAMAELREALGAVTDGH